MEKFGAPPESWKSVKDLVQAKRLVDIGLLLTRSDAKNLAKLLPLADLEEFVRHVSVRFADRWDERLAGEILVETLLNLLHRNSDRALIGAFLEEMLLHSNYLESSRKFVELSLTMESIVEHSSAYFVLAVSINCELGMMVRDIYRVYPEKIVGAEKILSHVSTYLLSVSNANEYAIRLSLINYLGVVESIEGKHGFNRIMSRFGFTVLEYLFKMLFDKRTEGVALQYLLENLPYVLEGDQNCQMMLHQTMRAYMLKLPERFALFVKTFSHHVSTLEPGRFDLSKQVFLKHMGQLMAVVSEVNHMVLAYEISSAIMAMGDNPYRTELIDIILADNNMRDSIKELLRDMSQAQHMSDRSNYHTSKRGRRPCFAKTEELNTLEQVCFLGQRQPMAKAS